VGVVIPVDYSERVARGEEAKVQILIDGSDSNTASIALGYAQGLVQLYSIERRGNVQALPIDVRTRVWYKFRGTSSSRG
jgi:ABC-2 type transport system permease protein